MTETAQHTRTKPIEFTAIPLLDVSGIAEVILHQALGFCAEKMGLQDETQALDRLRQGDSMACSYWHYALAQQVAEQMGAWDEDIQAAYVCTYDATPQDVCFSEQASLYPVHIIIWAQRKTAALRALVETMDHALLQCCADIVNASEQTHILDIQIVDDNEVQNRLGYGAMLSSIYNRPIQIWQR